MPLPDRLLAKPLEDCTPDEARQKLAWPFARQAWDEGLDDVMRKGTWEAAGKRLYGPYWERAIADCVVESVREVTDVDQVYTLAEIAQLVTVVSATDFNTRERKQQLEKIIDGAAGFLRAPSRNCPVLGIEVTKVWRRTA